MKNQLSSWKTYYKRVNDQINRKSDDRLSAFQIGKINNDLVVGKSYNIHHIVYQLLQPPQNTMTQIRKMIFQNKFCLLRKFLHEPYANQPDKILVSRLKNLYVQQCLLDKNLKNNLKPIFIENFYEIDLWYSESESEKQENINVDASLNNNLMKQNTQTLQKLGGQIQKKESIDSTIGTTTIEKQQIMQLGVLQKMLKKTREKKEKQRMEQAEMVKLDENLKVIIFQDNSEKEENKLQEDEKQIEEKPKKKETENKLVSGTQKLKLQKQQINEGEQSLQQQVKGNRLSMIENSEEKLSKITKFRLTHYFGYAQYLKRDGLFDYFEPELISKVQENQSIKLQFEEKQKQKKLDKKNSKQQELKKKIQDKMLSMLALTPNKFLRKSDQKNYTFRKNDQGVILATPIKLNNPKNNIVTMAIPEFKFKKKIFAKEIKLNFQDSEERDFNERYNSPTKSIISYEPDLSSSMRSEKDSSLPLKQIRKNYLGEISENLKEEEFKKQIMKLKPVVDENIRKLSIRLEAQFTLEQIAEALSEESGDDQQIINTSSFKKFVEKLKQPIRTKTEFNFDRRTSFMVPFEPDSHKFDVQQKRHSISPNMKFCEISKDSTQIRSSLTKEEIPEGVTFRQQFDNLKQQKEADISEFSIEMEKKKKINDNNSTKKNLLFMSHETTEISSAANLLDHIYDIESECDILERPIMFRDLKHNPQFHQQKLVEQQQQINQIQAMLQQIIQDYQCDIIREKYFKNKLLKIRKRRTQKQQLEKQMKQRASNDLCKQIRRMSISQNIDQDIKNTFIKTYQGVAYLMKKKSIFSPIISKRIRHENQIIPFDFQKISKAIYTFNQISQLSENELNELQVESDSSSQDVEQDFQESFSPSPSPNLPNEILSSSFKSIILRQGSAISMVSPSINSKISLQDLKDDCVEKFSNLSCDSVDTEINFQEYQEINTQLEASALALKKIQKQRIIRIRQNTRQILKSPIRNNEESSEEQQETEEEKKARKNNLFTEMIAETKSMDFIRAFESQKEIQKERQEKLLRIQEIQKRNRPINEELAKTARQKFQKIMLDIVRSNKSLEVVELLSGLTKKAQQARNIGTMKPQEMNKLRLAIENNNQQIIADFVQFNSQLIDNQAEDGCTLLCLAVRYARVGIVEMLLKEGADANIPCKDGMNTPLHFAVNQNQKKITNLLINYGADEKIKNYNGFTPWEGI